MIEARLLLSLELLFFGTVTLIPLRRRVSAPEVIGKRDNGLADLASSEPTELLS